MKKPVALIPDAIFTCVEPPQTDTAIVWDGESMLDILPANQLGEDFPQYKIEGWLCPGFVNTHCHLELSWTKDLINQKTGVNQFIVDLLNQQKNQNPDLIQQAISDALEYAVQSGVAFVADIANGDDSLIGKKNEKRLGFHTFVELFGFNSALANTKIKHGLELKQKFNSQSLAASLTPHAPYSVSRELLKLISEEESGSLFSIHFRESLSEDEFFISQSGAIANRLKNMNIGFDGWNSMQTPLNYLFSELSPQNRYLWVHNTFITAQDFDLMAENKPNHWFCLCPRANEYIENVLPPINQIARFTNQITIGTDSLASNYDLSIWNELKVIQKGFPTLLAPDLIYWATANGADFFQNKSLGRLKKGYAGPIAHIEQAGQDLNKIQQNSHASLLKLM